MSHASQRPPQAVVVGGVDSLDEAIAVVSVQPVIDVLLIAGEIARPELPCTCKPTFPVHSLYEALGCQETSCRPFQIGDMSVLFSSDPVQLSASETQVDILITRPPNGPTSFGLVNSELGSHVRPRYHFFASDRYFELPPFGRTPTRIVGLASKHSGQKWCYSVSVPQHEAARPTTGINYYDPSLSDPHNLVWGVPRTATKSAKRRPQPSNRSCFMCLSSQNADKDLVVSVGRRVYLTTAKGPIKGRGAMSKLGCSGHVLLIPLDHTPSLGTLAGLEQPEVTAEIDAYTHALVRFYEQHNLGYVCFEYVRAATIHGHIQIVPVQKHLEEKIRAEVLANFELDSIESCSTTPSEDHLALRFSSSPALYGSLSKTHDLQLARRAICNMLDVPSQTDWRSCLGGNESQDSATFFALFKDLDPFVQA